MKKIKKILYVNSQPNNIYVNLANELGKYDDIDLHVVFDNNYVNKDLGKTNFKIHYRKSSIILTKVYGLISRNEYIPCIMYYKNFNKFLKEQKPDLVISNIFHRLYSLQSAIYCKRHKVPFILQTEIKRFPIPKFDTFVTKIALFIMKGYLFNLPKKILPWTEEAVTFAKEKFGKNNRKKIELLPPGNLSNIFKPIKNRKYMENNTLKLLMVARMVPYKKYFVLLKAIKYLKETQKIKFKLTIRGNGPLEEEIRKTVKDYGLENEVIYAQRTPYKKMTSLFWTHDVLILPSYNEAVGLVVMEALACGTPTITSDTVGANQYVIPNKTGLIFKTNDHIDLAKQIIKLYDKKKLEKFGFAAQKNIKDNFSINITAKRLYNIITKILDKPNKK